MHQVDGAQLLLGNTIGAAKIVGDGGLGRPVLVARLLGIFLKQAIDFILGEFRVHGDSIGRRGALIGSAWYDSNLELETEIGDGEYLVWGAAVFEELHHAGYTLEEIALMGALIGGRVYEHSQMRKEVQERLRFFGQTPEATH